MKVTNYASCLFEIFQIFKPRLHPVLFYIVDDLDYTVVHRGRAANFSSIFRNRPVDRIHLSQLAFLDVLKLKWNIPISA